MGRDSNDRPYRPVMINHITITKAGAAAPAAAKPAPAKPATTAKPAAKKPAAPATAPQ
jgi:hypothetical protein